MLKFNYGFWLWEVSPPKMLNGPIWPAFRNISGGASVFRITKDGTVCGVNSHPEPDQESPHSKPFLTSSPCALPRSDAEAHLGAAAAGAHDSTAGHGALGAGRPGGSALRLVPAVRERDWTERVTLSAELSVWCCTIVPRAAGSGACQRDCYMRQIVPLFRQHQGIRSQWARRRKKEEACHGLGRDIERSPLRRGRHWLCGW